MSLLAYELYIVFVVLVGLLAVEYFFYSVAGERFFKARAELEYIVWESKRLSEEGVKGKGKVRRLEKLRARAHVVSSTVKKLTIIRMLMLIPVYVFFSLVFLLKGVPLPAKYCVPMISFVYKGVCITTPAHIAVLTFIALLPFIQEDFVAVLMFKRARR